MNILVTAGNTQAPIDQVRCITNIFSGKTGGRIALTAYQRGHHLRLLTSHPEVIAELEPNVALDESRWSVRAFQTFDDLEQLMAEEITGGGYEAIIHCAAVSDYRLAGTFVPAAGTAFDEGRRTWSAMQGEPTLADVHRQKIKSRHPELWLRLVPTPKLVDQIRRPWGFRGVLVMFKLEVGIAETELRAIGERSRLESGADLMCANTLEGMQQWALLGPVHGEYVNVRRRELADRLLAEVERLAAERGASTGS